MGNLLIIVLFKCTLDHDLTLNNILTQGEEMEIMFSFSGLISAYYLVITDIQN